MKFTRQLLEEIFSSSENAVKLGVNSNLFKQWKWRHQNNTMTYDLQKKIIIKYGYKPLHESTWVEAD